MAGFSWLLTALGAVLGAIILDSISHEVRERMDRLPSSLIKGAVRLLPPEVRDSYTREFLGELDYVLGDTRGLRLTRLVKGIAYALSLWFRVSEVRREVGYATDLEVRVQRIVTASAAILFSLCDLFLLAVGAYRMHLNGELSLTTTAFLGFAAAAQVGWSVGVLKPGCAGSQSIMCLGFGGVMLSALLAAAGTSALRLDACLILIAVVALMASGFIRDFGSRNVRPVGLLAQAVLPVFAAASWFANLLHAGTWQDVAISTLAVSIFIAIGTYLARRMQDEIVEMRRPNPSAHRVK